MGVFERIASSVVEALPVETDLDMGDSHRVKNLPDPADPQDAETASNAQSKADAAESAAESYADGEIESHRQDETHATPQPPQDHGDASHSKDYITQNDVEEPPVDSVNGGTGAVTLVRATGGTTTRQSDTIQAGSDDTETFSYNYSTAEQINMEVRITTTESEDVPVDVLVDDVQVVDGQNLPVTVQLETPTPVVDVIQRSGSAFREITVAFRSDEGEDDIVAL